MGKRRRAVALVVAAATAAAVLATPAGADAASTSIRSTGGVLPAATSTGLPYTFEQSGYTPRAMPVETLPYNSTTPVPLVDRGVHDSRGVRMVLFNGRQYDHPWAQAAYGMELLNGYRVTHDVRYLTRARTQARRLMDTHIESRGAWFLPHFYPFLRHGSAADAMPVPFYSAMAQGAVLGFFTRLYSATGETGFKDIADRTFESFLLPAVDGLPWVVEVDAANRLWLEEWPIDGRPDFTYNGHTFANYGLYDYARLTDDPRAIALFDGAATTTRRMVATFRAPGWISKYCLRHVIRSARYHRVHGEQLLTLYSMTGDVEFAQWSDVYNEDFAAPAQTGSVYLAAGTHSGFTFDAGGRARTNRSATLTRATRVPIDERTRVYRQSGYWYRVTSGIWKGYLLREVPGRSFLQGAHLTVGYAPTRRVVIPASTRLSAVAIRAGGVVTTRTVLISGAASTARTGARSLIDGRSMLRIESGPYSGWWLLASQVQLT